VGRRHPFHAKKNADCDSGCHAYAVRHATILRWFIGSEAYHDHANPDMPFQRALCAW
jgi:hypothetical protein